MECCIQTIRIMHAMQIFVTLYPEHPEAMRISAEITTQSRRDFIRAGRSRQRPRTGRPCCVRRSAGSDVAPSWQTFSPAQFSTDETMNSYEDITTYNNYWEFGSGKADPAKNSGDFDPLPWKVTVDGHCEKTGTFDFNDFIKPYDLEERIYRCAVSKHGRWSFPGSAFRSPTSSRPTNQPRKPSTLRSRHCTIRPGCRGSGSARWTGRTAKA